MAMSGLFGIRRQAALKQYVWVAMLLTCGADAKHSKWPTWSSKIFHADPKTSSVALVKSHTHIVMILADDLGWNDVGWHGGEIETPRLNDLVDQGLNFAEMHAHSMSSPSRAALLTGRYAFHTGLQHGYTRGYVTLPRELPLISEQLREVGYSTYMVGQWYLGRASWADTPLERGFDSFFGQLSSVPEFYMHEDPMDLWDNCKVANKSGVYSTTMFTDKAIDIITAHATKKGTQEPMFLYLAYQGARTPMDGPPSSEILKDYEDIEDPGRRALAQVVTHLDASIGRITLALQDNRMWENTLLVFASDNGGPSWGASSNWPFRGGKATMWQGGLKVPAFVVHGGHALREGPHNFNFLTHLMDLAPTFLAAAGVPEMEIASKGYDGVNLWPYLTGEQDASRLWERTLVLNIDTTNEDGANREPSHWSGYAAIRDLEWKLVLGSPGEPSGRCSAWANETAEEEGNCSKAEGLPDDLRTPHLWHVRSDITESFDVADKNPHIVKMLHDRMTPYFDSAWEPLLFDEEHSPEAEASLMASIAGAWSPWEPCPENVACQCEDKALLAVFESRLKSPVSGPLQLTSKGRIQKAGSMPSSGV